MERWANDKGMPWQAIAVGVSVLVAGSAGVKTWFVNDYRVEQLETRVKELDSKIDKMDERLVRLQSTYDLLLDQARDHGWNIPWVPRRGGK